MYLAMGEITALFHYSMLGLSSAVGVAAFSLGPDAKDIWPVLQRISTQHDNAAPVAVVFLAAAALLFKFAPRERRRTRGAVLLFLFALALLATSGLAAAAGLLEIAQPIYWAALVVGGVAMVNLASVLVFGLAVPLLRLPCPRILRDITVALGYIAFGMALLSLGGMSVSGLITTSAVLTAVIGFSLQDTLGNIMGGLAVELEQSITVGDWVKINDFTGKVREIRWRYTALETRDWDTVIIPNSMIMKGQVVVLGRRDGQPVQHRQAVYFNVDFRTAPTEVIAAVTHALLGEPIAAVAAQPEPHCIVVDCKDSYYTYAARYWLTDLSADAPTDSAIRTRIFFALKRADIPLSIPAQTVFVTEDSETRRQLKHDQQIAERVAVLAGVELFHGLTDDELQILAEQLRPAPFAKGEAMTRQGAEAHWLYIITEGAGDVSLAHDDRLQKTVATLHAGDFFGEMGLLTGEKRSATIFALEDTECYRLDKEAFNDILQRRPEIADYISHILARRRVEYQAVREGLDAEAKSRELSKAQRDIFARIHKFFALSGPTKG